MILPIWLLLWFPSPLGLLVIPANFMLDLLVTWASIRKEENGGKIAWKNSGKICLAGFALDFVGMLILLDAFIVLDNFKSLDKLHGALAYLSAFNSNCNNYRNYYCNIH